MWRKGRYYLRGTLTPLKTQDTRVHSVYREVLS